MDQIFLSAGIILVFILALVCYFSLFERQIGDIIGTFFALILRPFLLVNTSMQTFWRGVRDFYYGQFTVNGQVDLQNIFFQFIGAVLYTLFFAVFGLSEFHLLALSLAAAGIEVGHYALPVKAGALTAFAITASILFWGAVICDLMGVTNTAPWKESLSETNRKRLLYIAFFSIALSLCVTCSMGLYRGKVVAEDNENPVSYPITFKSAPADAGKGIQVNGPTAQVLPETSGGIYYWSPIIVNVGLPILALIGGIFSSWGLVTLAKFIMLMLGFVIISPLGLLLLGSGLVVNVVDRTYQLVDAVFRLFATMGRRFLGLFGLDTNEWGKSQDNEARSDISGEEPGASFQEQTVNPSDEGWKPFK